MPYCYCKYTTNSPALNNDIYHVKHYAITYLCPMQQKRDITSRADIEQLVDTFYTRVKPDAVIGHYFTDVVHFDWDVHIPIMYGFWESVLLNTATYKGQVMQAHINLDKKSAFSQEHFDHWLMLWTETVNALFEGNKANEAIARAQAMAFLIHTKVQKSREEGFIK